MLAPLTRAALGFLLHHRVRGRAIAPGAAMCEMALAAGQVRRFHRADVNRCVDRHMHAVDGEMLHVMHGKVNGVARDVCLPCVWRTHSCCKA